MCLRAQHLTYSGPGQVPLLFSPLPPSSATLHLAQVPYSLSFGFGNILPDWSNYYEGGGGVAGCRGVVGQGGGGGIDQPGVRPAVHGLGGGALVGPQEQGQGGRGDRLDQPGGHRSVLTVWKCGLLDALRLSREASALRVAAHLRLHRLHHRAYQASGERQADQGGDRPGAGQDVPGAPWVPTDNPPSRRLTAP